MLSGRVQGRWVLSLQLAVRPPPFHSVPSSVETQKSSGVTTSRNKPRLSFFSIRGTKGFGHGDAAIRPLPKRLNGAGSGFFSAVNRRRPKRAGRESSDGTTQRETERGRGFGGANRKHHDRIPRYVGSQDGGDSVRSSRDIPPCLPKHFQSLLEGGHKVDPVNSSACQWLTGICHVQLHPAVCGVKLDYFLQQKQSASFVFAVAL